MKKFYLFAGILLASITSGVTSSCSNNDEPEIPTPAPDPDDKPDIKIDSVDVTLHLLEKEEYMDSIAKGSRMTARRPSTGGLIWYINTGDKYSIYESGTANKLGTVVCTDSQKGIYEGRIGIPEFEGSKEVYLALDHNASDNIQWDGKVFTFKNAYAENPYKGWMASGTSYFTLSSPTNKGAQRYYQFGKGIFSIADKRITGYAETVLPMPFIVIPKTLLPKFNETIKEKGYKQLVLTVQTDEKVLSSFTFDPVNLAYTFNPSSTNLRTIVYDAEDDVFTKGEDVRLYFTMEPGTWSNPIVKLYGRTSENGEMKELGSTTVADKSKKLEYIPIDKYDSKTAESYQRPAYYMPSYGNLELK